MAQAAPVLPVVISEMDTAGSSNGTFPPAPPSLPSEQVPTIVGIFWGLIGLVVIVLATLILWTVKRRRRRAAAAAAEAERQREQQRLEEEANRKPGPIPIIVVLPDDGVAFGWEVPFREESLDSLDSLCCKGGSDDGSGSSSGDPSTTLPV